jgi:hypothetical protein
MGFYVKPLQRSKNFRALFFQTATLFKVWFDSMVEVIASDLLQILVPKADIMINQ